MIVKTDGRNTRELGRQKAAPTSPPPPLFESLARILLSGFELDTDYPCPGTVLVLSFAKCACRTVSSELFHRSLDCIARRSVNGIGLC